MCLRSVSPYLFFLSFYVCIRLLPVCPFPSSVRGSLSPCSPYRFTVQCLPAMLIGLDLGVLVGLYFRCRVDLLRGQVVFTGSQVCTAHADT